MTDHSDQQGARYAEALAAFKHDSGENAVIASLLRRHLDEAIGAPVLDVGAGSGELAALAFPNRRTFLLDHCDYPASANPLHRRLKGDFLNYDLTDVRPDTLVFCHSIYFLMSDVELLRDRIETSGARVVIVVANEDSGCLKIIADRLAASGMPRAGAFHAALPVGQLTTRIPFLFAVKSADFATLSRHVTRILLDLATTDAALAAVERELRGLTDTAEIEIAEAIYVYRLP